MNSWTSNMGNRFIPPISPKRYCSNWWVQLWLTLVQHDGSFFANEDTIRMPLQPVGSVVRVCVSVGGVDGFDCAKPTEVMQWMCWRSSSRSPHGTKLMKHWDPSSTARHGERSPSWPQRLWARFADVQGLYCRSWRLSLLPDWKGMSNTSMWQLRALRKRVHGKVP